MDKGDRLLFRPSGAPMGSSPRLNFIARLPFFLHFKGTKGINSALGSSALLLRFSSKIAASPRTIDAPFPVPRRLSVFESWSSLSPRFSDPFPTLDFCDFLSSFKRFEKKARIGNDPTGLCVQLEAAAGSDVGRLAICLCGDCAVCIKYLGLGCPIKFDLSPRSQRVSKDNANRAPLKRDRLCLPKYSISNVFIRPLHKPGDGALTKIKKFL